ncbi:MAG: hypothetical protein KKG21_07065 [Candidatus Omnitrophica bacterium]|nr:hypothetical protein [Candidatus Omnitrophota bacterium]
MLKIRKLFNAKIISLIVSISFLFTATLYAHPDSRDNLRLHIGTGAQDKAGAPDDTFLRLQQLMDRVEVARVLDAVAVFIRTTQAELDYLETTSVDTVDMEALWVSLRRIQMAALAIEGVRKRIRGTFTTNVAGSIIDFVRIDAVTWAIFRIRFAIEEKEGNPDETVTLLRSRVQGVRRQLEELESVFSEETILRLGRGEYLRQIIEEKKVASRLAEDDKAQSLAINESTISPKILQIPNWEDDQAENIGLILDNIGVDRDGMILNMGSGTNPIAITDRPNIYNVDSQTGELDAGLSATVKGAKFIRANFYDIEEVLGHVDPTRNIAGIIWYNLPSFIRGYADRYSIWGEAFRNIQEQIPKDAPLEIIKSLVGEEVERLAFLRHWSGLNLGGYFIIASSLYPLSPQINRTQRFLSFADLIKDELEEVIVVKMGNTQVAVIFKKSDGFSRHTTAQIASAAEETEQDGIATGGAGLGSSGLGDWVLMGDEQRMEERLAEGELSSRGKNLSRHTWDICDAPQQINIDEIAGVARSKEGELLAVTKEAAVALEDVRRISQNLSTIVEETGELAWQRINPEILAIGLLKQIDGIWVLYDVFTPSEDMVDYFDEGDYQRANELCDAWKHEVGNDIRFFASPSVCDFSEGYESLVYSMVKISGADSLFFCHVHQRRGTDDKEAHLPHSSDINYFRFYHRPPWFAIITWGLDGKSPLSAFYYLDDYPITMHETYREQIGSFLDNPPVLITDRQEIATMPGFSDGLLSVADERASAAERTTGSKIPDKRDERVVALKDNLSGVIPQEYRVLLFGSAAEDKRASRINDIDILLIPPIGIPEDGVGDNRTQEIARKIEEVIVGMWGVGHPVSINISNTKVFFNELSIRNRVHRLGRGKMPIVILEGQIPVFFRREDLIEEGVIQESVRDAIGTEMHKLKPNEVGIVIVETSYANADELSRYFSETFGDTAFVLNLATIEKGTEAYDYFHDIVTAPDYRYNLQKGGLRLRDARKYLGQV